MLSSDDGLSHSAENENMRMTVKVLTLIYPNQNMKNKIHLEVNCVFKGKQNKYRSSCSEVFYRKAVPEIKNSHENTYVRVFFK